MRFQWFFFSNPSDDYSSIQFCISCVIDSSPNSKVFPKSFDPLLLMSFLISHSGGCFSLLTLGFVDIVPYSWSFSPEVCVSESSLEPCSRAPPPLLAHLPPLRVATQMLFSPERLGVYSFTFCLGWGEERDLFTAMRFSRNLALCPFRSTVWHFHYTLSLFLDILASTGSYIQKDVAFTGKTTLV